MKAKKIYNKSYYALDTYKPNKNCKQVVYKGITYASKKQCMVLNDIDSKTLEAYLNESK